MKVAKKVCVRCGSRSLRDDGGLMRCSQCGRPVPGDRPEPVAEQDFGRPRSKWDMPPRR